MNKDIDIRKGNIQMGKAGGKAGKNSKYYRAIVPPTWATAMGITEEDRNIVLSFDGEAIYIRKAEADE